MLLTFSFAELKSCGERKVESGSDWVRKDSRERSPIITNKGRVGGGN